MSIFSSQTSWTGMCAGANQSPIHLSQGSAKPCKGTCDLKVDDTNVTSGSVAVSDEGFVLYGQSLGSCTYNNISYNCMMLTINHPSHHTIEKNSQADGEVIAVFVSPQGEYLQVCVQFYVNPSPGPSIDFFKQIVPYASGTQQTIVNLTGWSLQQMIPDDGSYYVYDGSFVMGTCAPAETIVFKSSINIDQTDFALLVNKVTAGSRNIQPLGNREIFYNDGADTGFLPHDNKTYLVMKPLKPQKKKPELAKVDLKTTAARQAAQQPGTTQQVAKHLNDNWDAYVEGFFFLFFTGIVLYGWRYMFPKVNWLTGIYNWVKNTTGKKKLDNLPVVTTQTPSSTPPPA
jgi:carbonic anhydrase